MANVDTSTKLPWQTVSKTPSKTLQVHLDAKQNRHQTISNTLSDSELKTDCLSIWEIGQSFVPWCLQTFPRVPSTEHLCGISDKLLRDDAITFAKTHASTNGFGFEDTTLFVRTDFPLDLSCLFPTHCQLMLGDSSSTPFCDGNLVSGHRPCSGQLRN